jgi:hypothetical protein
MTPKNLFLVVSCNLLGVDFNLLSNNSSKDGYECIKLGQMSLNPMLICFIMMVLSSPSQRPGVRRHQDASFLYMATKGW